MLEKIQFRHALKESSINHIVLQGICKNFPHISIEWILTGRDSKNKQVIEKINALLEEMI